MNYLLLIVGFTVFLKIKSKFDFGKYKNINIIITHLHNDHAGSLSQLILYLWFIYKIKTNVICNCSHIIDYLDITGTPRDAYEVKNNFDNFTFIKTKHTDYLDAYGFCTKIGSKKIVYTGDTCIIEPFLPYLNDADEFYIDLSKFGGAHIKASDVLNTLKNIKSNGVDIIPIHMDDADYIKNLIG